MNVLLWIVAFLIFFSGIVFVLAKISDWKNLPNTARWSPEFEGRKWRFSSVGVLKIRNGAPVSLREACTVCVGERGILISPYFPASIAFRDVFLSWGDVNAYADAPGFRLRVILYVNNEEHQVIFLGKAADAILGEVRARGIPVYDKGSPDGIGAVR